MRWDWLLSWLQAWLQVKNKLNEMRRQLRMGADVDYVHRKMIGGGEDLHASDCGIFSRPRASGHSAD